MSLSHVWIETRADGLVRADQISGIETHRTPELAGKPPHWLLDVVLPVVTGSGAPPGSHGPGWAVGPTHRTLIQTPEHPGDAPTALARLLAQLDPLNVAGVITAAIIGPHGDAHPDPGSDTGADVVATASRVRFRFQPFPRPPAASHDTESHYL